MIEDRHLIPEENFVEVAFSDFAGNERENLRPTITSLVAALEKAGITYEILVANDHSNDGSEEGVNFESGASQNDMDLMHIINLEAAAELAAPGEGMDALLPGCFDVTATARRPAKQLEKRKVHGLWP